MAFTFNFVDQNIYNKNGSVISGNSNIKKIFDAKILRVQTYNDLPLSASKNELYYTSDAGAIYIGQGKNTPLRLINSGNTSAVVYSLSFEDLPAATEQNIGYIYRILNDFTTDNRFISGSGAKQTAGTSIMCAIDSNNDDYKYIILDSVFNFDDYVSKSDAPEKVTEQEIDDLLNELENM